MLAVLPLINEQEEVMKFFTEDDMFRKFANKRC